LSDTEKTEENEFANQKFKIKLVSDYIFVIKEIKGKEIKCSPDKKVFYPFGK